MAEVGSPESGPPPEEGVLFYSTPPEVASEVVKVEEAPKKPRKPRQPKVKLAAVSEDSTPDPAEVEPKPSKEPLPMEFWAGLMQTQKVLMAQRKTERYNSFRIV